jgi:hypothetical protein
MLSRQEAKNSAYFGQTMRTYSHYLYPLVWGEDGQLESPFPGALYSQYKYGCGMAARALAAQLFHSVRSRFAEWLQEGPVYVTASAYKAVPTAAQQICDEFVRLLDAYLLWQNGRHALPFRIERRTVFEGDYGKLEQTEREALMQQNLLCCNTDLQGCRVVVIDDVRITGSHERRVQQLMLAAGVDELLSLFIGKNLQPDTNGAVEHVLNHQWLHSLRQLRELMQRPHWQVNARVCKYLLSHPDIDQLLNFWLTVPPQQQQSILHAMDADGYSSMPAYAATYARLAAHVHQEHADVRLAHA